MNNNTYSRFRLVKPTNEFLIKQLSLFAFINLKSEYGFFYKKTLLINLKQQTTRILKNEKHNMIAFLAFLYDTRHIFNIFM